MKQLFYFSIIILAFFSCQKEIDIDLNDSNPQIVIEANYKAEDSTVLVLISRTTNYFDLSQTPEIDNASVSISNHLGIIQNLTPLGNGAYELTNYIPIYNTTYTMTVLVDGKTYTAESDMPSPTQLEDITYEYTNFFGLSGYTVDINFLDPADTVNHYIVAYSKNGVMRTDLSFLTFQDDMIIDGEQYSRPLFLSEEASSEDGPPILPDVGDSIGLEFRSVDAEVYDYYSQVVSIIGSGQSSAAPANPVTNWDNKALGYFSAYSISRKGIVIL